MRKKLLATVHILLDTEDADEAADALSSLLSESGIYGAESLVLDWAYPQDADGKYQYAKPIEIPDEADGVDLADYIAEHERERKADDNSGGEKVPCDGDKLELLRQGMVCEFMGRRWCLLVGEAIEDALRAAWRDDGGDVSAGEDVFLAWVLEGDRLVAFLPTAMGMDSFADTWWDRLRGAAEELLQHYWHECGGQ